MFSALILVIKRLCNKNEMRKNRIALFFLATYLMVPYATIASAACSQPIAKIASAQGKVDVLGFGALGWKSTHANDMLCPGDTLRTAKWSRATLGLTSGAVLTVDQNTTMTFSAPQEKAASWFVNLLKGAAFFRSRQPQNLDVNTPFINAVHEGTEFLVAVSSKSTEISVFDGKVSGENAAGKITINKGYKGIAEAKSRPQVQAIKITPEDTVQWSLYYPPIIEETKRRAGVDSQLNGALAVYHDGDSQLALARLDEIPTARQNANYLTLKAALLLTVGRVDEAQPLIQQAQSLEPNNSDAFALQAVIAVAKNKQQVAIDNANKAIAVNPQSPVAFIAQSYAYQSLFNIDEALKSTQTAIRLAPENALAWARLSELQLSQGDHDAALKSAQKAQALNPKIARTQTILGFANLAQTEIEKAKHVFEQALALDSSDPLGRLGLGLAKIRQGDVEAGKNELETAVSLDPNNAVIRSYLGKAYYELRNKDYAGKEFEIAKEVDPKDPTPYFYDAILKQTTNRPIEALHDMQKAIELNDNRQVYRSKLLLDKDEAARQTGLGRVFSGLGFDDVANRLAMNSLIIDPSNYSAHRLLSDSDATKPRLEIARTSEHLQSQLLQPLNYNPIQPSLSYTDLNIIKGVGPNDTSFNEYNRLFERNGIRLTSTGIAGSNSTLGDETALSGIINKFSYSLGQLHYNTDGFRKNNDLKHDIYNVFAQYEISPEVNVQAEYRHRETEHGDLEFKGNADNFDPTYHRKIDQDSYRYGLKVSPAQHSDFLLSFIHADRDETVNSQFLNTKSYDAETQYLFHNNYLNAIAGGGTFRTNNHRLDCSAKPCFPSLYDTTQYFGYLYSNYKVLDNLNITAGLSYDHYKDSSFDTGARLSELNPKFGLLWKANNYITFRAAAFKSVKSAIIDNQTLQPTQVAGFNQFFDDTNGTVAWQYGAGVDTHMHKNVYAGIEFYKRDLKIPISQDTFPKSKEELYRLYFNWAPFTNWVFNSEFRFENYRGGESFPPFLPRFVETAYLPTEIRFFHPVGIFATLKGTYVDQKVLSSDINPDGTGNFTSHFYLVDAAIGYRFQKQYGLISLEAKNLFDTNFRYRDRQFQLNEQRSPDFFPERMVFGRITLNF
ncbi:TonB-dependent receptor [Methyloglobulus morosus KoM1]|uniref:TonB-dependent receptor n=1 Tax=Methyloglobulus morosus KoM1 TaxID=1116472 RepID=V5C7P0_9GAMM|nr:TonB-dependent receptor [Methyloglobulus morosus]ESS72753.1 TonB-dependent receptor [Methyloglobulus morosus KoM1]